MFGCVEALSYYGIIHRDLTPRHFLQDGEGRLFLIGFGFSLVPDDDQLITGMTGELFAGSSRYAPITILAALMKGEGKPKAELWHDVESVVKVCIARFYSLEPALRAIASTDFDQLHTFWNEEEKKMKKHNSPLIHALEYARQNEMQQRKLFFKLSIDNIIITQHENPSIYLS